MGGGDTVELHADEIATRNNKYGAQEGTRTPTTYVATTSR